MAGEPGDGTAPTVAGAALARADRTLQAWQAWFTVANKAHRPVLWHTRVKAVVGIVEEFILAPGVSCARAGTSAA